MKEVKGDGMESVVPRDRSLADLFSMATSEDLEVLADLITDNGNGRLALDAGVKAIILKRREQRTLQTISDVLEAEIRAFGSNSLINLFRSEGASYKELVTNVAKKLDGEPSPDDDVFAIEDIVIKQAVISYAPERAGALATGGAALSALLGQIVLGLAETSGTAVGVATAGGTAGVVAAIAGRAAVLAVPALAVGAMGLATFQAVGPAYRIVIPSILQVAKMRRSRFDADFAAYSEGLRACL